MTTRDGKEEGAGQPPISSRPQGLRAAAVVSGTGKVIPRYPKPHVLQANRAEPHTVNLDVATTHSSHLQMVVASMVRGSCLNRLD
ncbi:hypothetical protein WH47_02473 [Habropoda laboriosa]|uniref:Uncharacterized protein n=1 Tax=Habropoda laboriosa TaxID=597456 RepID=A0A0L7QJM3_9HYME|nr:hypothetical protein WH47_02473 [Habropoda laboriosa]